MAEGSFIIIFSLAALVLIGVASYIWPRRKMVDEMHGMMVGMTLGMVAGLLTATLYLIPTGNFLWGVIIGSVVGLAFGIPFGRLGGHLGLMEGIVAGPMGGMMGAMLGQMIRPFSIEIFMPFFIFIFLITLLGLSYAVHCGVSCCGGKRKTPEKLSDTFIASWAVAAIVVLGMSVFLPFSIAEDVNVPVQSAGTGLKLPGYLQQKEVKAEAVQKEGYQEVAMQMTNSEYVPNAIAARKGVPLRITVTADATAGCARDIIFPDFNIRRIVPEGTPTVIEFTPQAEGTFRYHCSMDMARGTLIVTA
jgi:heme/copper-type cytochrome/quinol oxidase subunit 2